MSSCPTSDMRIALRQDGFGLRKEKRLWMIFEHHLIDEAVRFRLMGIPGFTSSSLEYCDVQLGCPVKQVSAAVHVQTLSDLSVCFDLIRLLYI